MVDFDPLFPPTTNSLNRLRLETARLPEEIRGKGGYELLSTQFINKLIQTEVTVFYEQVAEGADRAIEIAHTIGTRLGCLLLTLTCNDNQTHQANPDKSAAYWKHWSTIRKVYLGGGLVRGKVGAIIATQAQTTLQTLADDTDYQVKQVAHPQHLPLLGAARVIQAGNQANVLDFGGSYVKRAIAHYTKNVFSHLQINETLPHNLSDKEHHPQRIFEQMVAIIVESYADVDAPTIPVSIAGYVDENGQPRQSQGGIYMQLAELAQDVPAALSQAVSDRLGKKVQIKLLHDGTAAALYFVPMEGAAVIMLGTSLGSGYPVARPNLPLCLVSPDLTVDFGHRRNP